MSSIDDLAAVVRAGLDSDEDAAVDMVRAAKEPDRKPDFTGAGGPAAKWLWQRFSAERVLAEVASKRALLDEALSWEHGFGWTEQCYGDPCLCSRDDRVHAVLTLLAQPYQETDRG